ncbi:unnamed protein product, partial [Brassica oleracea var. botrytis]
FQLASFSLLVWNRETTFSSFDCNFSFTVWTCIAARCSIQLAREWTRTINHMQATLGESVRSLITSEDLKTPTQQLCPG